jgi:ABC-type transporter Mla MlaB component
LTDVARGEAAILAFSGPATIRQVTDAWTRLRTAVEAGGAIALDLSGVSAADLSFVQLIESARLSAERLGGSVTLAQPAAGALRDVLERGGFLDGGCAAHTQFWTHAGAD